MQLRPETRPTRAFRGLNGTAAARIVKAMEEVRPDIRRDLLSAPPRVINVGLEMFALNLAGQDIAVEHVRWSPPAGGDSRLASLLSKLQG